MRTLLIVNQRLVGWIQPRGDRWLAKRVAPNATTKPKGKVFDQAKDATGWVYGGDKS